MPWHQMAMKDVDSCDKLRDCANNFNPQISEWGNPHEVIFMYPACRKQTQGTETSKYLEEETSNDIP